MLYRRLSLRTSDMTNAGIVSVVETILYASWNEYTSESNRKNVIPNGVNIEENNNIVSRFLGGMHSIKYTMPRSYKLILNPTCKITNMYNANLPVINGKIKLVMIDRISSVRNMLILPT